MLSANNSSFDAFLYGFAKAFDISNSMQPFYKIDTKRDILKESWEDVVEILKESPIGLEMQTLDKKIQADKKQIDMEQKAITIGLASSFIITMTALIGGGFLVYKGHSTEGITAFIGGIATLAIPFLYKSLKKH